MFATEPNPILRSLAALVQKSRYDGTLSIGVEEQLMLACRSKLK